MHLLPSELFSVSMYRDFNSKHPKTCGIEAYRKNLGAMNISFAKRGEEQCETCIEFDQHKNNTQHDGEDMGCKRCLAWRKHLGRAGRQERSSEIPA